MMIVGRRINLEETWAGAHSTWPLLDFVNCETAFHAADEVGTGDGIDFSEFETLVQCLQYLNQKRHMVHEVTHQFHEHGMNDDDFHIGLNILGVHASDMEATAHFFAAIEIVSSEGRLGAYAVCCNAV